MKCSISVIVTHYGDYANTGYRKPSEPELLYKGVRSSHASVEDCLRHMVNTYKRLSPQHLLPHVTAWSDLKTVSHPAVGWGYLYMYTGDGRCVGLHIAVKGVPNSRTKA